MSYDSHENLAYATITVAPSPATSGTTASVSSADALNLPTVSFNATVWPLNTLPTKSNAEIVRVTANSTGALTITRAQESTSAKSIAVGWQLAATITKKSLTDIENSAVQIGGDLGGTVTSPTILSTHLTAPLPIAQGGSGAITAVAAFYSPADFVVAPIGSGYKADYYTTGSADETIIDAAIMAAAALPTGGSVYLKSGSYTVSSNGITPASNVTVRAEGVATIIQHDNTSSSYSDIGSKPVFRDNGVSFSDFVVENFTFIGNNTSTSTSCAIYLDGDGDPDAPGTPPVISNIIVRKCNFRNTSSLPVRIFGLHGKFTFEDCEFTHCADAGFGWNEEVIFMGNHSLDSTDNGFSISRGNRKVICVGNTSENATFWGIWLAGFDTEVGPDDFVCDANIVINPGYSGIALYNAPSNFSCNGNFIDQGHNRPTGDGNCDGIQIRGASLQSRGLNGTVNGNTIINASRAGISYAWVDQLTISSNTIVDAGTQYKADGVTTISSTDKTTNVGILELHLSGTGTVFIDGNNIIDTRATPYTNYDIYPVTSSTVQLGINYNKNMRNSRNQLTIPQYVEPGKPLAITASGPDTNIDTQLNNKGSGETQVRGGNGLNIETTGTGTGAQAILRMSSGLPTSKIAGLTAKRSDPFSSSLVTLNILTNGALTSSDSTAPFYLQGQSGGNSYAGFNGGIRYRRRTVADSAVTMAVTDFILAYTTLTTGHTVTLPSAVQTTGQTFIIKDETASAATNNITISPFNLGSPTCTNADIDTTTDIFHLSTNIVTGTPVTLSTAGTLPSPLIAATTYYVTRNTLVLLNSLNEPGTLANDSSSGVGSWSNPGNATPADNTFATWTSDGTIDPSNPRGDTQTFSGSIISGNNTLTSSTSVFVSTDTGKYVHVPGAGAAGGELITTITAVDSATQVELATTAGTTVSGVTSAFGSVDSVTSQYLKVSNFGFSIPTSAVIQGVVVHVKGKSTTVTGTQNLVYDATAQLVKGGTIQGSNYAIGTQFSSSNNTSTYGASSDLWGLTLTASDVNSSNFGFVFQTSSLLGTMNVDDINITVYYITPNDIQLATSLSNAIAGTQIDLTTTGSGTFTFAAPTQTIDGASSKVININNGAVVFYSDGSNWQVQGGIYNTSQTNPTGTAGGDLGSTYPNPTVVATHLTAALPVNQGGTGVTTSTGTGNTVLSNSPTLVTPALGTPVSGVATNLTGTASALTAGNVTTNANLTGPITSSGNATSIASQTGTGTKIVVDTSPTLVTPNIGVATATSVNKVAFTAPTTAATLAFGTDNTTQTFQGTDTIVGRATTDTLTNKRITKRISSTASSATPTPNGDTTDIYEVTALAAGATFGAPTGTPVDGDKLIIRIKDNGGPQTLAWNAIYRFSSDLAAPTTTVTSKTLYLGFIYNSADSKWDCIALLGNF